MDKTISVVIPAKNEAESLVDLLPRLKLMEPQVGFEIIVVNDGSIDDTSKICDANNVIELKHPYSKGNGAAIKAGVRAASGDIIVCMDADGQHDPREIPKLLSKFSEGYEMVVGARPMSSQAGIFRAFGNWLYNSLASYITGHKIDDLTSGFRVVDGAKFREYLYLLPNGFSYPTTITMAFFRAGYPVAYEPIVTGRRKGKSHLNIVRDGARFFLIIFKVGTLYSPLKLFAPAAISFFGIGLSWYAYTFFSVGRFTNMSALLMTVGFLVLLMGLISEQIATLIYKK